MDERLIDQQDPALETIVALQRSITATMTYIIGRASVAELFGVQAYLSNLASQMAPVEAARFARQEMPAVLRQQLAELERQEQALRHCTPAQYRQES